MIITYSYLIIVYTKQYQIPLCNFLREIYPVLVFICRTFKREANIVIRYLELTYIFVVTVYQNQTDLCRVLDTIIKDHSFQNTDICEIAAYNLQ